MLSVLQAVKLSRFISMIYSHILINYFFLTLVELFKVFLEVHH